MCPSLASPRLREFLWVSVAFLLVRAVQYSSTSFFMGPLYGMHALDVRILREDLLRGLLHLHSQPPLYNLLLGVVLKLFPDPVLPTVFACLYGLLGLAVVLLSYGILMGLAIPAAIRAGTLALLLLHPPLLSAERAVAYTLPVTFLLVLSGALLILWVRTGRKWVFPALLIVLSAVVLTRSFFDLFAWLAPSVLGVLLVRCRRFGGIGMSAMGAGLLSFALAATVYFKNLLLFGAFSSSTWLGMNVSAMTAYVEEEQMEALIREGKVTPLQRIERFSPPEVYLDYYNNPRHEGHPSLTDLWKSTGKPNCNHIVYLEASREYLKNSVEILSTHPWAYLKAVVNELNILFGFTPGLVYAPGRPSAEVLKQALAPFSAAFFRILAMPAVFFMAFSGILLAQLGAAKRMSGRECGPIELSRAAFLLLSSFNMVYVVAIAGLLELGEGCFMRIPIDPFILIGAGHTVAMIARAKGALPFRAKRVA